MEKGPKQVELVSRVMGNYFARFGGHFSKPYMGVLTPIPFDDARSRFDIRFYLVSISFIISDSEVTSLFPWAVSLNRIGSFGFWSMMVPPPILTIGSVYEWKKGALDWE